MSGGTTQSIPIKPLTFNWDSSILHEQWTLFREWCQFLLKDGPYSTHTEPAHTAVVLNWMVHINIRSSTTLCFWNTRT